MKFISEVTVQSFRSLNNATLPDLGHFTALAGQNNSGKSNLLRALNAFFSGNTDPGSAISVDEDYYRPDLGKKKAKRIRVSIKFSLPDSFKFRKSIRHVGEFLRGREFTIAKEWSRAGPIPKYFLNGDGPLEPDDRVKCDQFLDLIAFRYIPNRVLPLEIIRGEHHSLRDVLVRRLAPKIRRHAGAFDAFKDTSSALIRSVTEHVREACPQIGDVRLATPDSWQDLAFLFAYKLATNGVETDDVVQGSGIQSLLMLETLSLIDRDFFQRFGWKQAAIWALEEPESSLHNLLEARVAKYLSDLASEPNGRLQIVATTHSDLVLQYADRAAFAKQSNKGTSFALGGDKKVVLEEASRAGISRWVHPILWSPLSPVVLVEGKYDHAFLQEAFRLLGVSRSINVSFLEHLEGGPVTGGVESLIKYLKTHFGAIRTRVSSAPVVVVLDWDSASKAPEIAGLIKPGDPCIVMSWPEEACNPRLGKSFRGIERYMSDRVIEAADGTINVVNINPKTLIRSVLKDEYGRLKSRVYEVVSAGLTMEDLHFAKEFILKIGEACGPMPRAT